MNVDKQLYTVFISLKKIRNGRTEKETEDFLKYAPSQKHHQFIVMSQN